MRSEKNLARLLPFVFALFLVFSFSTKNAVGAELKIGLIGSFVGGHLGDYGGAAKQGFLLALKEYNAKGGYKGQKVEGILYEDEGKPAKGVENITRLITRDKVFGVLGAVASGVTLAMIDVAQKYEVPLISPISTAPPVTERFMNEPKNYIFRTSLVDSAQISLILDYLQKKGYRKIGILNDTTGWGETARAETLKQFENRGLKPALPPERFSSGDTDMTAQLSKFKKEGVDFIIALAYSPEAVQILKSMAKIDYKVPMASTWGLVAPNFLKLGGKELIEGTISVASYTIDATERAKAFHRKIVQEYGEDYFPVCTAQTYDATRMLLRALDKVGPDPKKIRDALEMMDHFNDAVTAIKAKPFANPKNHEALSFGDGYLVVWKNGVAARLRY
jgi:branched-chain amino acid transport system substrate-binding protein